MPHHVGVWLLSVQHYDGIKMIHFEFAMSHCVDVGLFPVHHYDDMTLTHLEFPCRI